VHAIESHLGKSGRLDLIEIRSGHENSGYGKAKNGKPDHTCILAERAVLARELQRIYIMSKSSTLSPQRTSQEIPTDRWIPFLAEFTRENRGAHARLEIVGSDTDIGYGVETEDRPFEGVSADIRNGERTVWVAFGSKTENHMTHGIRRATAIRVLPPAESTGAVLEIEGSDGTKTILELSHPEQFALAPAD
jgi:hypothetical protein